ncbi:MAG: methyl-accepting chemotaxis protein [Bacillota bacterium]
MPKKLIEARSREMRPVKELNRENPSVIGNIFSLRKKNCWDYLNCPQNRKEKCPAYTQGAGRRCWRLPGTFCGGEVQGSIVEKLATCLKCEVYHKVNQLRWFDTVYVRFELFVVLPVLAILDAALVYTYFFVHSLPVFITVAVGATFLSGCVALAPAFKVGKPIRILNEKVYQLCLGNLASEPAMVPRRDEYMLVAIAINDLGEVLRDVIKTFKKNADILASSSEQLTSNMQQLSAGATETAGTISQIAATVENVGDDIKAVSEMAEVTAQKAGVGTAALSEVKSQMQAIEEAANHVGKVVEELEGFTGRISRITELITEIADQTNLLALNAAIEAARAGEHGRGFAVVATEVRRLAEQSAKAAEDIRNLIVTVQGQTRNAVGAVAESSKMVEAGTAVVGKSAASLEAIIHSVKDLTGRIEGINRAAGEIGSAVNSVAATVEEQTAVTEEVTAAAEELAKIAEEARRLVENFKV